MRRLRCFEFFVMALVLGVVICFCIQPSSHLPSSLTALSSLPPAPPFPTTVRRKTRTSSASTIYYLQPLPPLPALFSPWLSCSAARRQALWQLSQVKWSAKAPSIGNSHPGCVACSLTDIHHP